MAALVEYAGIALVRSVGVRLFKEPTPLPVSADGPSVWDGMAAGDVVLADPENGQLVLSPGLFLVTVSGGVRWFGRGGPDAVVIKTAFGGVRVRRPSEPRDGSVRAFGVTSLVRVTGPEPRTVEVRVGGEPAGGRVEFVALGLIASAAESVAGAGALCDEPVHGRHSSCEAVASGR